jgi:hypothetical protein
MASARNAGNGKVAAGQRGFVCCLSRKGIVETMSKILREISN